jgi:hypothetical protein
VDKTELKFEVYLPPSGIIQSKRVLLVVATGEWPEASGKIARGTKGTNSRMQISAMGNGN